MIKNKKEREIERKRYSLTSTTIKTRKEENLDENEEFNCRQLFLYSGGYERNYEVIVMFQIVLNMRSITVVAIMGDKFVIKDMRS